MYLLKRLSLLLIVFFISFNAQTTDHYYQTFDNNILGWATTAYGADFYVQDGLLHFQTDEPEDYIYLFPPIPATMDDFSIKIFGAEVQTEYISSLIGRAGFKSMLGILINPDSLRLFYSNNIEDFYDADITWLYDHPQPNEISSLELKANVEGNNLTVSVYLNETLIHNGLIENVPDDLLYGQVVFGVFPEERDNISFSLDAVQIDYNPFNETSGNFVDNFNFDYSPWFRCGDWEHAAQAISIGNGKLNFNYDQTEDSYFYVIAPVGAVRDFSMEIQSDNFRKNGESISRFFDMNTYVTLFFDEDVLHFGYLDGQQVYDPFIIAQTPVGGIDIQKVKFGIEGTPPILDLKGWVNDDLILTGSINNASENLGQGFLLFALERDNYYNFSVDQISITYDEFLTSINENISLLKKDFTLFQNYPNPFNPSTVISYFIHAQGDVLLKAYDSLGKEVAVLVNDNQMPGYYSVQYNAENLTSGVYFYRLQYGNNFITKKFVVLR